MKLPRKEANDAAPVTSDEDVGSGSGLNVAPEGKAMLCAPLIEMSVVFGGFLFAAASDNMGTGSST